MAVETVHNEGPRPGGAATTTALQLLHSRLGGTTDSLTASSARMLLAEGVSVGTFYDALLELMEADLQNVPPPDRPVQRVAAECRLRSLVHTLWADGIAPRRDRVLLYSGAPSARTMMLSHLLGLLGTEAVVLGCEQLPLAADLTRALDDVLHVIIDDTLLLEPDTRVPVVESLRTLAERKPAVPIIVTCRPSSPPSDVPADLTCRFTHSLVDLETLVGATVVSPLTAREVQVLQLVSRGRSNTYIARDLDLSVSTVKTYLARVHAKLGTVDRASAIAACLRKGWLL